MQRFNLSKKLLILKLRASLLHSMVTISVAATVAALVFFIWYPNGLSQMLGGAELFKLVILGEVILGPLLSVVVYSPLKSKAELLKDYGVIVSVQLLALCYGVYSVANSRPVYMVFVKDRVEIVSALEYEQSDLDAAGISRIGLPLTGPKFVCSERPSSAEARQDLMFAALEGRDIEMQPVLYRACTVGEVFAAASEGAELKARLVSSPFEDVGLPDDFMWLPLHSRFGVWTIIFPKNVSESYQFVNIDSYELPALREEGEKNSL